MKMVGHPDIPGYKRDDLRSHLQRLDRTETQPLERRDGFEYVSKEFEQRNPGSPIATVGAEVNPRKHHFLVSPTHQRRYFFDDARRRQATASPAHGRNDAERTVRITPILHFDDGARAAAGSWVGLRLQVGLQKDIAAENFCAAAGLTRLKVGIEYLQGQSAQEWFV